jgi:hypothetical protein
MSESTRVPISLLLDDCAPAVHVYAAHCRDVHHRTTTKDGRPLLEWVPNSLLDDFADVVERRGIKGKFSIVPNPGGQGDIPDRVQGVPRPEVHAWLETVKRRVAPQFDFTPEMITHNLTLDLATGTYLPLNEHDWSQQQDRTTLTPYIAHALSLLKQAGFDANGVTSPWTFGGQVVAEYEAAIVAAQKQVYGRDYSWYFCHSRHLQPGAKPWVAIESGPSLLVHVPSTTGDAFWQTIDSTRTDAAWISQVADGLLTADGKAGEIREMVDNGGWPILVSHWQSLFSNGLRTGLRALDEVGRRVRETLGDTVEWGTCAQLCERLTSRPLRQRISA